MASENPAHHEQAARSARVLLRPIANPLALGFFGLAGATLTIGALQLGWIPADQRSQAGLIVLVVGPLPMTIASIFGFLGRDDIAATGMGWMAATWLAYGLIQISSAPGSTSTALGAFLVVAGAGCLLNAAGSGAAKGLAAAILALAGIRFLTSGIYELGSGNGWRHVAGWAGVALCPAALYGALALALEDLRGGPVLPTLRGSRGRDMFREPLARQVRDVAQEAGVRREL
jgi:uncharacterized protein